MKKRFITVVALVWILALPVFAQEDEAKIQGLIAKLKGFDFDAIQVASDQLFKIGQPAVPLLIKALKNDDPGIRKGAAQILGDLKVKEAIIPISELLQDQQYWVVRAAVYALGNTADPAAIPPLRGTLKHYHPTVKEAALSSLDELQAKSAMADIAGVMLTDPDQYVRWRAMTVLRSLEDGSEVKAISDALKDPKAVVQVRRNAATFAGNLRLKETVPLLLAAFDDPDEGVRWRAIEAVGEIGDASTREAIEAKLKDPQRDVQMFAISVLGKLGKEASVPALSPLLKDKIPEIKKNTIRSLRRIGGEEAARALRSALSDSDYWVRAMAVETLAQLGDKNSLNDIKLLASDTAPSVRAAVMAALGELGGKEEKTALEAGVRDDNFWVRQEAQRSLAQLGLKPGE